MCEPMLRLVKVSLLSGKSFEEHFKHTATVRQVKARAAEHYGSKYKLPDIELIMQTSIVPEDAMLKDLTNEATVALSLLRREKHCAWCYQPARRKCQRCMSVRYCNKDCQLAHWPLHKSQCGVSDDESDDNTEWGD